MLDKFVLGFIPKSVRPYVEALLAAKDEIEGMDDALQAIPAGETKAIRLPEKARVRFKGKSGASYTIRGFNVHKGEE